MVCCHGSSVGALQKCKQQQNLLYPVTSDAPCLHHPTSLIARPALLADGKERGSRLWACSHSQPSYVEVSSTAVETRTLGSLHTTDLIQSSLKSMDRILLTSLNQDPGAQTLRLYLAPVLKIKGKMLIAPSPLLTSSLAYHTTQGTI